MEAIDANDAQNPLTTAQLTRGAHGLSYRAEQLAGITSLRALPVFSLGVQIDGWRRQAIINARVESALVNARALSYFLTAARHNEDNLHISHYSRTVWKDESARITRVGEAIIKQASSKLAHASIGDPDHEPHPGEWPLAEIATILVGGIASFVEALDAKYAERAAWFVPDPREAQAFLQDNEIDEERTIESDHPDVCSLTRLLQAHLDGHAYRPCEDV